MIQYWIDNADNASWETLATSLDKIPRWRGVAIAIKMKYIGNQAGM